MEHWQKREAKQMKEALRAHLARKHHRTEVRAAKGRMPNGVRYGYTG